MGSAFQISVCKVVGKVHECATCKFMVTFLQNAEAITLKQSQWAKWHSAAGCLTMWRRLCPEVDLLTEGKMYVIEKCTFEQCADYKIVNTDI